MLGHVLDILKVSRGLEASASLTRNNIKRVLNLPVEIHRKGGGRWTRNSSIVVSFVVVSHRNIGRDTGIK